MTFRKILFCLVCMVLMSTGSWSQTLRHLTVENGLSCSAVFSVVVDADGLVWVGLPDGLSVATGNDFDAARFQDGFSLDGHVVNGIVISDDTTLWAQSSHGLMKINRHNATLTAFPQFDGTYHVQPAPDEGVLVLDKNSNLHLFRKDLDTFLDLNLPRQTEGGLLNVASSDNYLWTFGNHGVYRYPWISDGSGRAALAAGECIDPSPVDQFVRFGNKVYLSAQDGILYSYDLSDGRKETLFSIKKELAGRGPLSGAVEADGRLFLSFEKGGVIRFDEYDTGSAAGVDLETSCSCCICNSPSKLKLLIFFFKSSVFCLFLSSDKAAIIAVTADSNSMFSSSLLIVFLPHVFVGIIISVMGYPLTILTALHISKNHIAKSTCL